MDVEGAFTNVDKVMKILNIPETVEKLSGIFAEANETKALALISRFQVQLAVSLGAEHAALVAGRTRDAWTTLHRTEGQG